MSSAPIVDRIRIIPRPNDFLDRNIGSSGEVFFNRSTNSLRVYSGRDRAGFEIARSDLNNVSNDVFLAKATEAGISVTGVDINWNNITGKPTFSAVATTGNYNDLTNKPSIPDVSILATKDYVNNAVLGVTTSTGSLFITADDSTQREVSIGETVKFAGGTGISTTSDAEGNITINYTGTTTSSFNNLTEITTSQINVSQIYEPAIVMLRVDNVGTTAYTFPSHYSGNNPTIYAISGTTIAFDLTLIPGHPFEIQDNTLNPFNTGLVHVGSDGTVSTGASAQGKSSGVLYWRIPETSSGTFVYQCQSHAGMVGTITVKRISVI